jgi:hypothetical protein
MPSLLTVAEVRQHIETDLGDEALQRLIDDADAEIIRRLGTAAANTDVLVCDGKILFLTRKASSITSITQRLEEINTVLAANDYLLLGDGYQVERLTQGTNPQPRWIGTNTIVYVPQDTTISRKRLEIDLVKLALKYDGVLSSSVGDVRVQNFDNYQAERERLLSAFASSARRIVS